LSEYVQSGRAGGRATYTIRLASSQIGSIYQHILLVLGDPKLPNRHFI
jgi:hypothetical protein